MNDIDVWKKSERAIEKSRRYYAHLDRRVDLSTCGTYITDPNNISKHSFYPFIHYEKKINRYSAKDKKQIKKKRDICYASHIDRCIFQLYNFILNELYNKKCNELGIAEISVAYRTNMPGKNNIDFSKEAIDFIRNSKECYVMIGDFTHFFDNLDHKYLKKQWCNILGVDKLPADHYAVFKNITQYSWFELTDLLAIHGLPNNSKGKRELNAKSRILSSTELRRNRSKIQKNKSFRGIPQGSPLSGVLANVYMLEIDKKICNFIEKYHGFYRRYSDDFIIVLPGLSEWAAKEVITNIRNLFNHPEHPGLELQPSKTQYYYFYENQIVNCGREIHVEADCSNRFLNFLGFTFDGKEVSIRDRTVSKFYHKKYKKIKSITKNNGYTKLGKRISKQVLYDKYSVRGANKKPGNFLTYVNRALEPDRFGPSEKIVIIATRNMAKIAKRLKKKEKLKTKKERF